VLLDAIWLDTKLSLRVWRKYPGLVVVVIAALALGIPTSLLPIHLVNLIDGPLPVRGGERIVALRHWDTRASRPEEPTAGDFFRWRDGLAHFEAVAATRFLELNVVTEEGDAFPLHGSFASPSLFELLGVAPFLGRSLLWEDEVPGAPDVIVLGYEVWQSYMGGGSDVLGRQLRAGISPRPYTVVGVMPEGFRFPAHDQFWIPLRPLVGELGDPRRVQVVGRLVDGASKASAEAEFRVAIQRVPAVDSELYAGYRGEVVSVARSLWGIPKGSTLFITVAQVFALLMLALACGCVGVLILARTLTRLGEFSVRSALGASRNRIVGQLFTETILLALVATGFGLIIADRVVVALEPILHSTTMLGVDGPSWIDFGVNRKTGISALMLAVVSAVFAGVLPGLRATRGNLHRGLVSAGSGASGVRFGRGSTVLIASMVSLTVCCLATSAALVPGLFRDRMAGLGIDASSFLAAEFQGPPTIIRTDGSVQQRSAAVMEEFRRRLASEPGVRGVAFATSLPGTDARGATIVVEGQEATHRVNMTTVYPGFFEGLGKQPQRGRSLDFQDLGDLSNPVIVNTSFVERVLGGRNPIGLRFSDRSTLGGEPASPAAVEWFQIVGVIDGLAMGSSVEDDDAGFYRASGASMSGFWLAVHVGPNPTTMTRRARTILAEIDPLAMIRNPTALSDVPSSDDFQNRLLTVLMGVVIGVAGLLGVCGLYALVSFTVDRRTLEIGVRRALGAQTSSVALIIVGRAVLQLCIGIVVGGAMGMLAVRALAPEPTDWLPIFGVVLGGALLMGLLSCVVPTLRGLRISTAEAFRGAR
jgi:predicted permease